MDTGQHHIVRCQRFELTVANEQTARQCQQRLQAFCQDRLPLLLDALFCRATGSGTVVAIDRLELDLGNIPLDRLETTVASRIDEQLGKLLAGHRPEENRGSAEKPLSWPAPAYGSRPGDERTGNRRTLTPAARDRELLVAFVHTGTLPWWAGEEPAAQLTAALDRLIAEARTDTAARDLLLSLVRAERPCQRLIEQFDDPILARLAETLASELAAGAAASLLLDLDRLAAPTPAADQAPGRLRLRLWTALLAVTATPPAGEVSPAEFAYRMLTALAAQLSIPIADWRALLATAACPLSPTLWGAIRRLVGPPAERGPATPQPSPWPDPMDLANQVMVPETPAAGQKRAQTTPEPPQPHPPARQHLDLKNIHHKSPNETPSNHPPLTWAKATAGIGINNSGLVLLWPYIDSLLSTLGLANRHGFINQEATLRGVHLLQYLVTGAEETAEYHLPLNKVLCGIELEEPLPLGFPLTAKVRAECETLLAAVIHHWQALKNTSVAGLQRAFFQRQGLLRRAGDHWLLQVERATHDVLLEKLPWSISVIKLSWMELPLYVEW